MKPLGGVGDLTQEDSIKAEADTPAGNTPGQEVKFTQEHKV